MNKLFKIILCSVILIIPLITRAQDAQELILSYHSDIVVQEDSPMVVKETIKVLSTGEQIQHGIYRDFPIAYRDRLGKRYLVEFELLEVTRDGQPEPYQTKRSGNGQRIYIGQEQTIIPPGEHTYSIKYKTGRQLGFFEDHDELYWNVTGNGWVFPIDSASAKVTLPGNVPKEKITTTFYTGDQGSTAQDGTSQATNSGAEFSTNRILNSYEGLTIVVGWPKGIITPPSDTQNFIVQLKANLDYIFGILGFVLVLIFYVYMWNKRGKDPRKGTIIPFYEPPSGFSPALLRFINRMGSDNRGFASAIIDMGVKGALSITEQKGYFGKKTYTLTKKDGPTGAPLTEEEKNLQDKFFEKGNSFELKKGNAAEVLEARQKFVDSLKQQAGKKYFVKNIFVSVLGIVLSILTVVGAALAAASVRFEISSSLQILFWPALFIALLATNIVFGFLIRAFTAEGRKLADEIEGFKLFLAVTEKDRLAFHNPPEKTPELFEKFLPYALALGVEHKWAQQFSEVFERLENRGTTYAPLWYYGSFAHFSPDSFASDLGKSFAGVVASSSTPPGSGSGFSGGSSGGGGGGGGGGGW